MLQTSFWKNYFTVYDNLNVLIPYRKLLNDLVVALEIKRSDKILDAGSGTGNLSVIMSSKGADVTGFDSSLEGISIHRKKQPNIDIVHGSLLERLPFPDQYFDKVVCNNTIYTLPVDRRINVFKEFYRVTKMGGRIVVSNISNNFNPWKMYVTHICEQINNHGLWFTLKELTMLFIPTTKLFYYNYLISKEKNIGSYQFVDDSNQIEYLERSGYINISGNMYVYADQAILNIGFKP